jgi:DsbC/DsbD-like thiol-disulfide interchange protein
MAWALPKTKGIACLYASLISSKLFSIMKRIVWIAIFTTIATASFAQIKNPVKWNFISKKIDATTWELHMTAAIDPGWHIYTLDHSADIGVATAINLKSNPLATASGKITVKGKPVSLKDPGTGEMVKFYEKSVDFVQVVKLKAPVKTSISGSVEFMACDDRQCLPPSETAFNIAIQ